MSVTDTEHGPASADKGLKSGALGLVSSVVIGVASTAPAYSLAATLGFVVIAVGVYAPAIMLVAFLPMLFIAIAYDQLNRREPDCGTTFTWAAKAFGPRSGWMGGWGIIAADVIVMANLAQIAGIYSFSLFDAIGVHNTLAESTFWTTVVGVAWIVVMTWICYRGIEVSARMQYFLLGAEVIVLVLFAVTALVKVYTGHAPDGSLHFSWSWLNPFGVGDLSAFSDGLLLAVFIYWGWDTAVSVNEESDDPAKTPGRAAVLSTLLLLATYAIVSIAAQAFAGVGDTGLGLANPDNADDVFASLGEAALGSVGVTLLIIATLTSASASTQTTILPTARATLSMAVYKAIPRSFARIHPRYLTPTVSTIAMGLASVIFYVALTLISGNVLADSITSIGLLIAFYYGLTGFACAWYFRHELTASVRGFVMKGLLPLVGGLILLGAFIRSAVDMFAEDYGETSFRGVGGVFLLGVGSLLLGVVLMIITEIVMPDYFRGRTLTKQTHPVVLPETRLHTGLRLPDAEEPLVIAADGDPPPATPPPEPAPPPRTP
ncbi:MAG TPA: APC family permease [Mycobacteriales bacterium]|jgi:amino acid transporter